MEPSDLAALLGISTNPLENKPAPDEGRALLALKNRTHRIGLKAHNVFWAKFGALYLPSFFQLLMETPFAWDSEVHRILNDISTLVALEPWVARWVRTRQEEALKLWTVALERISSFPIESIKIWFKTVHSFKGPIERDCFVCIVELYFSLINDVRIFFPLDLPLPFPSVAAQKRLKTMAPLLRQIFERKALLLARQGDVVWSALSFLLVTAEGHPYTSRELREVGLAPGTTSLGRWKTCHALMEGVVKEETCVDGTSEDMLMCGRCQTVRYCSHAHQKEHWKKHKSVCFAPNW
ncbi:hypothetical protein BDY24DRAFT_388683 [Mrakia frigida]|uniref:zinc finger MYND domain-containing protein n=1 Tax=Mrakia frigida TaxID=29902 RepID=UPI003FCC0629